MLDELRQIAIFAKTVDHGSFRAAAKALRLSPSVVSHHVGQLEQNLGTALLYRSTRKLSLTPDGERLLESAHEMIHAAESGLEAMSSKTQQPSGVIRVTIPALFTQSVLMDQLAQFSLEYPKVELSLDLSEVRRDIITDRFDLAIRAGKLEDSSFKAQKLFEFNRRLIASPAYLSTVPKIKTPNDLSDCAWLELTPIRHLKTVFRNARKRQLVQKKISRITANSSAALVRLSRAGAGMAIVPESIAQPYVDAGELNYVLTNWTVEPINVFAVWPSNAPKNGLVRLLVKYLKAKQ